MIRNACVLILSGLFLCFCSCKKDSGIKINAAPDSVKIKQTLIVGKWTLQKQTLVAYTNNAIVTDTTCIASATVQGTATFNNDSTFTSTSSAIVINGLSSSAESATVSGKYGFTKTAFTLTPTVTGLYFSVASGFGTGTVTSLPVLKIITHTAAIINISSNALAFHTTDIFTETYNGVTTSYENIQNFYYTK